MSEIRAFTRTYANIRNQIYSTVRVTSNFTTDGIEREADNLYAVWDTGAMVTCISDTVAHKLGLISVGKVNLLGIDGGSIKDKYILNLFLPNGVSFNGLTVNEGKLDDIDLLIGMDIISQGDFAISNYKGQTVFSYRKPSENILDFVAGVKMMQALTRPRKRSVPPRRKN